MSKAAEKLTVLNKTGEGILVRLSQVKKTSSSPTQRPTFIGDSAYSKVHAALLKKFPDFEPNVEKTPGFDLLTTKSKVYFDESEPYYKTFLDAYEFKEAAALALAEIASGTVEMKLDDNPTLTTAFLDLFALYAQVNFLVSTIDERKLLLAIYYKLYFFIKCTNEPNFGRIANWLVALDNPVKAMQDELKSLNTSLGKTLINLFTLYAKLRAVTILRKEGALNLTLKPEEMSKPVTDKFHYQMVYDSQMYLWIMYGYLLCPEALAIPSAIDLLKTALQEGFVTHVHRNTTVQLHGEYDNLFNNIKSKTLKLPKKLPKEMLQEALTKAAAKHRERRTYIRQELNALYHLFLDTPGLLGPKFPILLCALSMAKDEVFWYFRHIKAAPPKNAPKKFTEDEFKDQPTNRITEIMYLMDRLVNLVKANKQIVQQYYVEYLTGADLKKLNEICNANFMSAVGPQVSGLCKSVLDELHGLRSDGINHDFRTLRMNWFVMEATLSSVQSPVPLLKVKDAVDRFNLVAHHTRFVDDIDELLDRYGSLKGLWYWKDGWLETFRAAIKLGPNQPLHSMTFFRELSEFPFNATAHSPEEQEEIGSQVVTFATKMLEELSERATALLLEVGKQYFAFENQLDEVNSAMELLRKQKDFKLPKDYVPPPAPGTESEYRKRPHFETLRLYERNCWQLLTSLNELETIQIYDQVFAPREFLYSKLQDAFRKFLRTACVVETTDDKHHVEKNIQRPTIFCRQLSVYIDVLRMVENYVDIDMAELIRETLISEIWIPAVGKSDTLNWLTAEETDFKYDGAMIGTIVNWYSEFITKKVHTPNIVFSPSRKGFVSKTTLPFKAENYSDIVELKALCSLVGPYGVKLIDREIFKFVLSNVNALKDAVSHNKAALDELKRSYHNEVLCNEALKKFRDCDAFLSKSIAIGNALSFRDVLHEALRLNVEEKAPYIFNTVSTSVKQYRKNTFMVNELMQTDMLALDCGIEPGTADQALKRYLARGIGSSDSALWDLLPYMYAASFTSSVWKEAQYRPGLEAHSNGAHTLTKAINSLIIAFKALTTNSGDEKEIVNLLRTFVEVSSVILLRMAKSTSTKPDKHGPVDFPSIIIFMDKFVQSSPLLSAELLENCLPYSLLKNEWRSIYQPARTTGKKEQPVGDVF